MLINAQEFLSAGRQRGVVDRAYKAMMVSITANMSDLQKHISMGYGFYFVYQFNGGVLGCTAATEEEIDDMQHGDDVEITEAFKLLKLIAE